MTLAQALQVGLAVSGGALALWCMVLGRRLRRLNNLETGLGGAIAVMTSEIARLEAGLAAAQREATLATQRLAAEVERSRSERALWALQPRGEAAPRQRLRRRPEVHDA